MILCINQSSDYDDLITIIISLWYYLKQGNCVNKVSFNNLHCKNNNKHLKNFRKNESTQLIIKHNRNCCRITIKSFFQNIIFINNEINYCCKNNELILIWLIWSRLFRVLIKDTSSCCPYFIKIDIKHIKCKRMQQVAVK